MTRPANYVTLTAEEASMVLSVLAEMPGSGCPVCYAFGYRVGYRRGCQRLAFGDFWDRDPGVVARRIRVRPAQRRRS